MSDAELTIGDYQLIQCIATGNSSQIWEVVEQGSSNRFAMKLLLPEALQDSGQVRVLKHEAKVGKSLEHPNFVKFHKLEVSKKHGFIVMDYFRAPNLKTQIMVDRIAVQVRLRKLVEALCMSLGYMHGLGWIHKDVKPDNILMSKGSEIRLIDFSLSCRAASGLSKLFGGRSKTIQGTRTYIAPEVIRRQPTVPQTDMYSLGITLFEVLTGQPPFTGSSPNELLRRHLGTTPPAPSDLNFNVTPEMDKFVLRLLSKKPAHRPKDMDEVHAEFRSIKIFKEDVEEVSARMQKERDAQENDGLSQRLDSRIDASRDRSQTESSASAAKAPAASKPAARQPVPSASAPQPGNPPPQQQPPVQQPAAQYPQYGGPVPVSPQFYPAPGGPQYAPPQYHYPQQGGNPVPYPFPPGTAMPPGQPPTQPVPNPQAPGAGHNAPPMPQQPPAQQPPATQPSQPSGEEGKSSQQPRPADPRQAGRAASPKPETKKPATDEDLPMMDELPPVL